MGTSRGKREEAHTHTHTFPSSLCSQSKTQETLFLIYIFYDLSYIYTRSNPRRVKIYTTQKHFL